MNDDRRMMECAAKAAGIEGSWSDYHQGICYSIPGSLDMQIWKPLKDGGDALRLAAHLKMLVDFDSGIADVEGFEPVSDSDIKRAITLAAARLGGYDG